MKKYQIGLIAAAVLLLTVLLLAINVKVFSSFKSPFAPEKTVMAEAELKITFPGNQHQLDPEKFEAVKEVLFRQLEDNGISLAQTSAQMVEPDSVLLKINGIDQKTADKIAPILMNAQLHFRLVHENNASLTAQVSEAYNGELPRKLDEQHKDLCPAGYEYMLHTDFTRGEMYVQAYFVKIRPEMDGRNIQNAHPRRDEFGNRNILIKFNEEGKADFARITGENTGRQLAIVINGKLCCAPTIQMAIGGGSAEISGQFSENEAKTIAQSVTYARHNVRYAIKMPGSDRLLPFKIQIESIRINPVDSDNR